MSSSNIKSWADHCSSDEESDDDRIAPPPSGLPGSSSYGQLHALDESEDEEELPPPAPVRKSFALSALPDRPPYTAFLGSLPNALKNTNDLGREVEGLLRNRGPEVAGLRVSDVRLMIERDTGKSRGYGYVEFDTPEELLTFLHMENPMLCGKSIKVDLAESQSRSGGGRGSRGGRDRGERGSRGGRDRGERDGRGGDRGERDGRGGGRGADRDGRDSGRGDGRGPPPPVDGSQFRGGRYARGSSGGLSAGGGAPPAIKRHDSSASHGSSMSGSATGGGEGGRQRPSLKLLARTKPVESTGTAQSSIFGGAKPRDEAKFIEKKPSKDDVTSAMEKLDVKENGADDNTPDDNETPKTILEKPHESSNDGNQKEEDAGPDTSDNKPSDARKQNFDRKDSKGSGRGGRGGGRREGSGRNKGENGDGRKKEGGRRDSTRKSGRGGRGGGKRENSDRSGGKDNRGSKSKNGNREGKDNVKADGGGGDDSKSSLAAAAAGMPTMPVKETKKVPPKKANSFAAFMDDSDED